MAKAKEPYVCLDDTLIRADRIACKGPFGRRLWYSGKHKAFVSNVQVRTDSTGYPVWVSPVEPGSAHDITTARTHVLGSL